MFIEITEILRCPRQHEESYVICGPVTMEGRDVVRGGIVCPACRAEYPIVDRIAFFGPPDEPVQGARAAAASSLTAEAVVTFLDLQGEGGYVVTVGAAGRLGPALGAALPGVGIVAVNPPAGTAPSDGLSVIVSPRALPVRAKSVRAVVVGGDAAAGPWLDASVAALLPGLRIVVEDQAASPAGITRLAAGGGVFVGEK
jgi:uncharacterized protein YbaR (Trm112 family)